MTKETENLGRNHVFDWNSISDNNVDKYADNLTEVLSNDPILVIFPDSSIGKFVFWFDEIKDTINCTVVAHIQIKAWFSNTQ